MSRKIRQGEIYTCILYGALGSEQGKQRPCLIIQNNKGNEVSPTTIVLPISSRSKKDYPFHYSLFKKDYDFFDCEKNIVLCEQVRCVDMSRLVRKIGEVSDEDYKNIYNIYCQICKKNIDK